MFEGGRIVTLLEQQVDKDALRLRRNLPLPLDVVRIVLEFTQVVYAPCPRGLLVFNQSQDEFGAHNLHRRELLVSTRSFHPCLLGGPICLTFQVMFLNEDCDIFTVTVWTTGSRTGRYPYYQVPDDGLSCFICTGYGSHRVENGTFVEVIKTRNPPAPEREVYLQCHRWYDAQLQYDGHKCSFTVCDSATKKLLSSSLMQRPFGKYGVSGESTRAFSLPLGLDPSLLHVPTEFSSNDDRFRVMFHSREFLSSHVVLRSVEVGSSSKVTNTVWLKRERP